MDYLSRIKTTVVDTVSNLSSVLTGNPLSGQYEIGNFLGSYGPGLLWHMHHAVKRSTREEACVFLLEKKNLDRFSKTEKDYILSSVKRGVAQLTRLRHPSILTVSHPLEESREAIAFATEPCFCSLSNILGCGRTNHPSRELPDEVKDYSLHDVEIKYGLSQIAGGLMFLHQAKRVHGNLSPEMIVINKKGAWKLAGFDLCVHLNENGDNSTFDISTPVICQPNYDYAAPECVLDQLCSPASDMYSLGILVYAVHSKGATPYSSQNNLQTLRTCLGQFDNIPRQKLQILPQGIRDQVKLLLSSKAELRPDAFEFDKLPFLEDARVKTLRDLDSLYQLDKVAKSHVYKGLPPMIEKLPERMKLFRVLPCLANEYVNPEMVPFVLPSILLIAECVSVEEFRTVVLPDFKKVFTYTQPVHIMYLLLQKMDLLIEKCPPESVRDSLLPMVYRALECDSQQIQELSLNTIPTFAQSVEYGQMKNHLLPKIKCLCIKTSLNPTRVKSLVCLGRILEHLDKWVVLDDVIAWLPEIKSRDSAVIMAIVGIYRVALTHQKLGITKEILACGVIPFLVPIVIEGSLSLNQFNQVVALTKDMLIQIETEQRSKLEQTDTGDLGDSVTVTNSLDSFVDIDPLEECGDVRKSGKLSLAEKKRIANQEEALKLFEISKPLSPSVKTFLKSEDTSTRDLTASLMDTQIQGFAHERKINKSLDTNGLSAMRNKSGSLLGSLDRSKEQWGSAKKQTGSINYPARQEISNVSSSGWDDSWGAWSTSSTSKKQVDLSEFDTLNYNS